MVILIIMLFALITKVSNVGYILISDFYLSMAVFLFRRKKSFLILLYKVL